MGRHATQFRTSKIVGRPTVLPLDRAVPSLSDGTHRSPPTRGTSGEVRRRSPPIGSDALPEIDDALFNETRVPAFAAAVGRLFAAMGRRRPDLARGNAEA